MQSFTGLPSMVAKILGRAGGGGLKISLSGPSNSKKKPGPNRLAWHAGLASASCLILWFTVYLLSHCTFGVIFYGCICFVLVLKLFESVIISFFFQYDLCVSTCFAV